MARIARQQGATGGGAVRRGGGVQRRGPPRGPWPGHPRQQTAASRKLNGGRAERLDGGASHHRYPCSTRPLPIRSADGKLDRIRRWQRSAGASPANRLGCLRARRGPKARGTLRRGLQPQPSVGARCRGHEACQPHPPSGKHPPGRSDQPRGSATEGRSRLRPFGPRRGARRRSWRSSRAAGMGSMRRWGASVFLCA